MEYRVEQLASACDVSVDTIRFYQSKGLLPAPSRKGRVAWYARDHVERIRRIKALQRKGLSLALIGRVLGGKVARADAHLAEAVAAAQAEGEEEFITLDQLAERSGVPAALLQAIERDGIAVGRHMDGEERFTAADVQVVRAGLRLLEAGLPLGELLALARDHHAAVRALAERAVQMFDEHVRKPVRASALPDDEKAARLVATFRELLPAASSLVAHHFRRVLLAIAEEHIERVGDQAEIDATRAESRRPLEIARRT